MILGSRYRNIVIVVCMRFDICLKFWKFDNRIMEIYRIEVIRFIFKREIKIFFLNGFVV